MPRTITTCTVDGVRVHTVTADEPYQVAGDSPAIHDGDVVVIENVVGVRMLGFTCAVTKRIGQFAVFDTEQASWGTVARGQYADAHTVAMLTARQLGAPVMRATEAVSPRPAQSAPARTATARRTPARKPAARAAGSTPAVEDATVTAGRKRVVPAVMFQAAE